MVKRVLISSFFVLVSTGVVPALAGAKDRLILRSGEVEKVFALSQIKKKLKTHVVTVKDPVYKKSKTYLAFELKEILGLIASQKELDADEVLFTCSDGYQPTLDLKLLSQREGYLAFAEKGVKGGWSRFKQGKSWMTPAPYYLIWKEPDRPSDHAFPWPYQVVSMELVRFKEKFSKIYPLGVQEDAAVFRGFVTFKNECMRCHSINLQGGELGPELNIPKNISEYWDADILREFVLDPGKFRARSKMPAFPSLSGPKLDELMGYIRYMKDYKAPLKLVIPNS